MGEGWRSRLTDALVMVIAVAVVGRVAWELLAPTLPLLITIAVLLVVGRWLVGSRGGYR